MYFMVTWNIVSCTITSADQQFNMASKESPFSRTEIQEAIKKQGEKIRQLKLQEQTDEVKNKVNFGFRSPMNFLKTFMLC